MQRTLAFLVCIAPLPGLAQGACPTGETFADTPIVFTVDGEDEVHRRAPNGVVTIDSAPQDGVSLRAIMASGVHVLQLADLVDGVVDQQTVWRFVFPMPIADLPAPEPGKTWNAQVTTLIEGETSVEQVSHTWGEAGVYTVGACSFGAIPVQVRYDGDDYHHVEEMIYFPDLGTAILLSYSDNEGTDVYEYTAVRSP